MLSRALPLALLTLIVACDGTRPPVGLDGGRRDAGDAALPPVDGNAGSDSGSDAGVQPTTCVVLDSPPLSLGEDGRGASRAVSIVPSTDRFHVVWVQSPMVRDEIRLQEIPSSGPVTVAPVLVADAPIVGNVGAVGTSEGWVAVWDDNSLGGYEIRSALVGTTGTVSSPVRLTNNALRDDTPSLTTIGNAVLLGFVRDDGAGARSVWTLPLSANGAADGAELEVMAIDVARVAHTRSDLALTWIAPGAGGSQALLQELTPTGAPTGSSVRLDTEGNAVDSARLASQGNRSAAVFGAQVAGARAEVRFQSLDENGQPDHVERVITPSPDTGSGPGIAPLAGGWAVAYRTAEASPRVRLALVDFLGAVVASFDVGPAASQGGSITVEVAGDGRILVAWVDVVARRGTVRAARVACGA